MKGVQVDSASTIVDGNGIENHYHQPDKAGFCKEANHVLCFCSPPGLRRAPDEADSLPIFDNSIRSLDKDDWLLALERAAWMRSKAAIASL